MSDTTLTDANQKQAIRRQLRTLRRQLSPAERRFAAARALTFVQRLPRLQKARRVGLYWPMADEFDPLPLMCGLARAGKACFMPVVPRQGRRLWFTRVDERARWYHNRFGIPESKHPERLRAEKLDVILVPLMGVDHQGFRLGMGGGFYDTSLQARRMTRRHSPWLLGVAFECQRVERLPSEPWDIRLDALLTERGIYRFAARIT